MKRQTRVIAATALCALAFGAALITRGIRGAHAAAVGLHYVTRCEVVESYFVEGTLTNLSPDTYEVRGAVVFKFPYANSMGNPQIQVQANALIPPGGSARLARARLSFQSNSGERCEFQVDGSIRKI